MFASADGVLNATGGSAGPALSALLATAAQQRAAADAYGLPLLAYEAGQGMTGPADSYLQQALAIAVNRDARMAPLYTNYTLSLLQPRGGDRRPLFSLLNHFSSIGLPSRYGSWGLMEGEDSTLAASPKLRGLQAAAAALAGGARTGAAPTVPATCPVNASASLAPAPGAPCSGAGSCVDDPLSGAPSTSCACQDGYYGPACENHEYLDVSTCSYQCSGHGTCVLQSTVGFTRTWGCACAPGYSGPQCTAFECPAHCSFNGRCVDAGRCACFEGYAGADCSVDCGCGDHGACAGALAAPAALAAAAAAPPPPSCVCDAGYAFTPAAPPALITRGGAAFVAGACTPVCAPGLCSAGAACLRPGVCACAPGCVHGECLLGQCRCWAGWGGGDCARAVAPSDAPASDLPRLASALGVNLAGVAYWSTEWTFMDLAHSASPWISQHAPAFRPPGVYIWDLGTVASPQNLSAGGNWPLALRPGQQLGTLMARDVAQRLPSGRYTVLYEGGGDLEFGFDARVAGGAQVKRGRVELDVALSPRGVRDNGIYMTVTAVDARDPIRNIRVLMPGCEELWRSGLEFHPAFLATWVNASALRFMDLAATNVAGDGERHVVDDWARRPTRDSFSFQGRSIPLESMVHLANLLGADPWFIVHVQSPPGFGAATAALVASQLRPDLSPLLELGNEVWSAASAPNLPLHAAAAAQGVHVPVLVAQRAAALAAAWDAAFQASPRVRTGLPPRLILSTFTVNPWYTAQMLTAAANCSLYPPLRAAALFPGACASPAATFPAWRAAAGLGVSAYMDCGDLAGSTSAAALTAASSVPAILAACKARLPTAATQWAAHASPLPLAVYEGGPGLVEASAIESGHTTPGLAELLQAASAAPEMEGLYSAWLAGCGEALGSARGRAGGPFARAGGALPYMHFSSTGLPSIYGSWGAYAYTGAALRDSPRARALVRAWGEAAAALAWRGCASPGALNFNASAPLPPIGDPSLCAFAPAARIGGGGGGGTAVFAGLPALAVRVPPGAAPGGGVAMTVSVVQPRAIASLAAALAGGQGSAVWAAAAAAAVAGAGNATNATSGSPAAPLVAGQPPPQRALATAVYDLGPSGTKFSAPVLLCFDVGAGALSAGAAAASAPAGAALALYSSSDGGATWAASENSTVSGGGGGGAAQLCGDVWHFSLFAGFVVPLAVLEQDVANATAGRVGEAGAAGGGTGAAEGAERLGAPALAGIACGAAAAVALGVAAARKWARGGRGIRQRVLTSQEQAGRGQAAPQASQRFKMANILSPLAGCPRLAAGSEGGGGAGQRSRVSQVLPVPAPAP
jgi:hypothetical protein